MLHFSPLDTHKGFPSMEQSWMEIDEIGDFNDVELMIQRDMKESQNFFLYSQTNQINSSTPNLMSRSLVDQPESFGFLVASPFSSISLPHSNNSGDQVVDVEGDDWMHNRTFPYQARNSQPLRFLNSLSLLQQCRSSPSLPISAFAYSKTEQQGIPTSSVISHFDTPPLQAFANKFRQLDASTPSMNGDNIQSSALSEEGEPKLLVVEGPSIPMHLNMFDFPEIRGKYKVIEKIGEGTFSSVYKAVNLGNRSLVALKRVYSTSSPARVSAEIRYLHMLKGHPNLLNLLAVERHEGNIILVLPYIEHENFKDYFQTMSVDEIRKYMRSLFSSLQFIHEKQIIHRDVKPSNFLHSRTKGTYMLVDFGLAQMEETPSMSVGGRRRANGVSRPTAARGGTRGFRAPEVLFKWKHQGCAIDIWSAGVILLCILSHRYPFFNAPDDLTALAELGAMMGTQELSIAAHRLGKQVFFPRQYRRIDWKPLCIKLQGKVNPSIPASVYDLLDKCLDLNPYSRITASQALHHPFLRGIDFAFEPRSLAESI